MSLSRSQPDVSATELRAIARVYVRDARAMSYRDLRARQAPPWASVAYGAAGLALMLARPRRRAPEDLAIAGRWLEAAAHGARASGAFHNPAFAPADLRASLSFGPGGIDFVRLLVAHAARQRRAYESRLRPFLARCRALRGGPTELVNGAAGHLTGLVLLHRRTGDLRALEAAGELALDLSGRASGWARSSSGGFGFAHGRPGTFHALLGWSQASGERLPASFFDHLAELAAEIDRGGAGGAREPEMQRSWCNGAAGHLLLWARVYEHTADRAWLRRARKAARFVSTHTGGASGGLCCGLAGRAYGLLAMDRIEPGRGWDERALAMAGAAARVMLREGAGPWPNSLNAGYPGIVCLARDVLGPRRERVGFPLIEERARDGDS